MSSSEEHRFDSILLALAEQHKNGVPEVIAQFDVKISVEKPHCLEYSLIIFSVAWHFGRILGTKNRFFCRWKRWRMANRKLNMNLIGNKNLLRLWQHQNYSYLFDMDKI